jgi:hypothetical protein
VSASDDKAALKAAIELFALTVEDQKRLLIRRS